jgi:hypothetical protein
MRDVDPQRTTFTTRDYARAVIRAWRSYLGATPSRESVGCLWAQYALETGRGAFCWCHNIGNVKWTPGHDRMMLRGTWEIVSGKRVVFEPPDPQTWFNAYASLDDAMAEHLRLLREKRYASSWGAIERGDPTAFATQLKARGYFTAPLEDYARGLRSMLAEFVRSGAYEGALDDLDTAALADTVPELPADAPVVHPVPDTVAEAQRRDD